MWEHLFSLWGAITVIAVAGGTGSIATTVAKQWRKAREAEIEANLEAEMVRQGRSAEEIERILRASSSPGRPADDGDEDSVDERITTRPRP